MHSVTNTTQFSIWMSGGHLGHSCCRSTINWQIRDYFNSVSTRQAHLLQISLSLYFWTGFTLYHIYFSYYLFLLVKTSSQAKTVHSNKCSVSSGLTDSSICLPCRHFIYQPEQNAGINLLQWTTETSPVLHPFDYHLIRILANTWHNKVLFVDASPATSQQSNKVKSILLHRALLKLPVEHLAPLLCYLLLFHPGGPVSHLLCSGSLGWWSQSNFPEKYSSCSTRVPDIHDNKFLWHGEFLFGPYWAQLSWTGLHIWQQCWCMWRSHTEELRMDDASEVVTVPRKPFFSSMKEAHTHLMLMCVCACVLVHDCVTSAPGATTGAESGQTLLQLWQWVIKTIEYWQALHSVAKGES